ncbi:MAG: hypothetical protein J6N76_00900, partial [Lachnospiraceae bacterium]|nr:hypothetical protein [Lachnospiraceae bacterium]
MQHKRYSKGKDQRNDFTVSAGTFGAYCKRIMVPVILAIVSLTVITGCSIKPGKPKAVSENTVSDDKLPSEEDLQGTVRTVIIGVDKDTGKIKISHVETGKKYELLLTDETLYFGKTGNVMVEEQLEAGDIADITASVHSGEVDTVQLVDGFIYSGVTDYSYSINKGIFTTADVNYRIGSNTLVIKNSELVSLEDIMQGDTLKISGVDHDLYAITVESGLGYVRLTGGEYFKGGIVEIGKKISPIEDDMLMEVPEGQYEMRVIYNNSTAKKAVRVGRSEETYINLAEFKGDLIKYGKVSFTFDPPEAQVTVKIDGEIVSAMRPVELEYGIHNLIISAPGFRTIKNKIRVAQEMANLDVELEEAAASENAAEEKKDDKPAVSGNPPTIPSDTFKKTDNTASGNSSTAGTSTEGS